MKRFFSIRFITHFLLFPVLLLALHFVVLTYDIYASIPIADDFMHLLGGGVSASCIILMLHHLQLCKIIQVLDSIIFYTLTASLTCVIAVLWEVIEFISDMFMMTTTQIGIFDTLSDIVFGIIGSIILLILNHALERYRIYT